MKNLSFVALLFAVLSISSYRMANVNETQELSWDVLGYYLPLPATFIYDDFKLKDISWLDAQNQEKDLTGTYYMIGQNRDGDRMYFFLFGMAVLYLPFFFAGHGIAYFFDYPMDGFSEPYQYAMVAGALIYMVIGLWFLRKVLLQFYSEKVTALVILLLAFGSNYVHHMSLKNLETVNVLFMLCTLVLWYTIKWHRSQKFKYLLGIGLSVTLMAWVKPSEILIGIVPLLWTISSKESLKTKWKLIKKNRKQIAQVALVCLVLISPQMIYWMDLTGQPIYDSYKNPGVGLDFLHPYIFESLFSFRKGWFLYTPLALFLVYSLYVLYKKDKVLFYPLFAYFLVAFYVITSWTEWWYGAGFSNRPLITTYPILAIAFGAFLTRVSRAGKPIKVGLSLALLVCVFFNQFYWWQLKHYILDPTRMTEAYFKEVFLKTEIQEKDRDLLLVRRDYYVHDVPSTEGYLEGSLLNWDFEEEKGRYFELENDNTFFRFNPCILNDSDERIHRTYCFSTKFPFEHLSNEDHLVFKGSIDVRFGEDYVGPGPILVMAMERKNGDYGCFHFPLLKEDYESGWNRLHWEYLTPEIRNHADKVKFFVWIRSEGQFDLDNIEIDYYERASQFAGY